MNDPKNLLASAGGGIRRIMQMRTKNFLNVTLVFLVITWTGILYAQARGTGPGMMPSRPSSTYMDPFGVPLAPGIYLANFMILYFINPDDAANMPAYMAAIPQEVYECLAANPGGCPYDTIMKGYFDEQALLIGGSRNKKTFWPSSCQTDPRWQALAAPEYRQPDQINQPLGRKRADLLARLLNMDQDMILTDKEYKCMIGTDQDPPSNEFGRDIIRACLDDLTNSKGNTDTPLSSYGLSLDDQGNVRSNCAEGAPCLEFNKLALPSGDGSRSALFSIADECKFVNKLERLIIPQKTETPFPEILLEGVNCQKEWGPDSYRPCIVETTNPGNGGQSKKSCAPSIATH